MQRVLFLEGEVLKATERRKSSYITAAVTKCQASDMDMNNKAVAAGLRTLDVLRLTDMAASYQDQPFDRTAIDSLLSEINEAQTQLDVPDASLAQAAANLHQLLRTQKLLKALRRAVKVRTVAHGLVDGSRARALKLAISSIEAASERLRDATVGSGDDEGGVTELDLAEAAEAAKAMQVAIDEGEDALTLAQELHIVAGAETDAAAEDLRRKLDAAARSLAVLGHTGKAQEADATGTIEVTDTVRRDAPSADQGGADRSRVDLATILRAFSAFRGQLSEMRGSKLVSMRAALLQAINSQDLRRVENALKNAIAVGVDVEVSWAS